jgi:hypothetical protein
MTRPYLSLLVFVGGAFVGPLLYWSMPLLPRSDLFYYGVGPLIWPVQVIGPVMEFFGTDEYIVLVGLNVVLYTIVGAGIVAAARKATLFLFAGGLVEVGVAFLALSAVRFNYRDLLGYDGAMLIALLIGMTFYGFLIFLVYIIIKRLQTR